MPLFGPPDIKKLKTKRDVTGLIRALRHSDPGVRHEAAKALGELGDARAAEPLIAAAGEGVGGRFATPWASMALMQLGEAAVDPLIAALSHDVAALRAGAARVLGTFALQEPERIARASDALAAALRDEDENVREAALYALGEIGDERAVVPLIEMLHHSDTPVRETAARKLGKSGDPRAVVPLVELLSDPAVYDAVFSAANLLCANGAGDPARLATAIWNYNHSQTYVNEVLTLAANYGVISLPDGVAYAAATDLLRNPRVVLTPNARADLEAGAVDPKLVSLLAWVAERHTISITVFKTGHSKYTRSGNISLHFSGSAADIFFVDGAPVSAHNGSAEALVLHVARVQGTLRPSELGHPFGAVGFPGGFTDADHRDHLHIGFD